MESLQVSIQERAKYKQEYDKRMNDRMMLSKEGKVDLSKSLNARLVITESSRTKSDKQDTSSTSGNDTDALTMKQALVHNSSDPDPTRQEKASVQISSDPTPKCQTMALEHNSLSPGQPHAENDQVADDEFINIFSTS
nr:hypothetical protein [Tanacetum cinerariifolium]